MLRKLAQIFRRASGKGTRGAVRWDGVAQALHVEIEFSIEVVEDTLDGGYIVNCVNLPGCMSQGETVEEAFDNIGEAIGGVMAARIERQVREQEPQIVAGFQPSRQLTVPIRIDSPVGERIPA